MKINSDNFLNLVEFNLNNDKLSDSNFRKMIGNSIKDVDFKRSGSNKPSLNDNAIPSLNDVPDRFVKCEHPDHTESHSCEDRGVGCNKDCLCCCPTH